MDFWGSLQVPKTLVYWAYTSFRVLGKTQKGANCVANFTFDQTNSFQSFPCLLLICSFSPRVHSIPRGPLFINKIKTPRSGVLIISLKTARIWWIFDVSYGVLKILKSQNFDEIVFFSAGSEKSSVLWRTRFFGFRRKSKISQNYDFLIKEFGVLG